MINYLKLVEDVEEGNESPYKAHAILKELQDDIKQCLEQIYPILEDHANQHAEKSFETQGFKIEKRNGKANYNFKNVEEWQVYDKNKKDCEERLKLAYKLYSSGNIVANEESGEVLALPEVTYSKDVIVVKQIEKGSLIH